MDTGEGSCGLVDEAGAGEAVKGQVHPSAVVDEGAVIGEGSKVWHFSHILSDTTIGENCNIGQNVVVGPGVVVGDGCKIQNNVSVYKGVTLEDDVFCGPVHGLHQRLQPPRQHPAHGPGAAHAG